MIATQQDNKDEMLPLVDCEGHVTGCATRGECHSGSKLLHPVVHLHVFNQKGELYLQHRPTWKDIQPGKWDTSVGGHIDWGEDVTTALYREVNEELGIEDFEPIPLGCYVHESRIERELVNSFYARVNTLPKPSGELDGGRFWTRQEIDDNLDKGIFTPNFVDEYRRTVRNLMKQIK